MKAGIGTESHQLRRVLPAFVLSLLLLVSSLQGAEQKTTAGSDFEKTVAAAKKEGKVVVGIPPSADLRKQLEAAFKEKFAIDIELVTAPGPANANRIASEQKAGVQYFDALICGTGTAIPLVKEGMLEPIEPNLILSEVKDPKNWWGGHIWEDNLSTKRFLYSFLAEVGTGGLWHNPNLAKAEELRSFNDLLGSKWKGKIGLSDPRVPGSGQSLWSFLWEIKGEDYLKKLVQQDLFVSRDLRQIGDALAKGKLAISIGVGHSQYEPFLKSGLPVKQLPTPAEGLPASNGFGVVGIVKNPPHPNAMKVFINWFLSKDGQDFYGKVMKAATRRLDVETKWLLEYGTHAAKDSLTLDEYNRVRNHLEDKYTKVRAPAGKFAEQVLK
ncbi:MAG: ABC transporter substrate-binding protein [Candidatus Binatia bacterium]